MQYYIPEVTLLLTLSSFLYLLNVAEAVFTSLLEAGLLGSLAIGIIYGPQASNILSETLQETFLVLGYIGLLLLVFEAGLSTNLKLIYSHLGLSLVVGTTGVVLPIAFSILLLHFGYHYTVLQAFAAGASLCSTSLGTTLALLKPEWRQTKMGVVLLSAALFDDVIGLVIAAIISDLSASSASPGGISWQSIVRPILVSVAFIFGTWLLTWLFRISLAKVSEKWQRRLYKGRVQIFLLVASLSPFVSGAEYAGTSELFGAYLCGVFIAQSFRYVPEVEIEHNPSAHQSQASLTLIGSTGYYSPHLAFTAYIQPLLKYLLSPVFFASIGSALPIRSLGSVNGSSAVVWRGWIYSLLMLIAKALTGIWLIIWPENGILSIYFRVWKRLTRKARSRQPASTANPLPPENPTTPSFASSPVKSALLLGFAMVARGEIALIVAQLARPILSDDPECFAVVIWAILVNTVAGAAVVGILFRSEARKSIES
ncbi:hypothetical protein D9758_000791 [Tetrapyrgos nigripes]|uniref:Cation/H+ exchanger transmembrane domain-containing protein n=1 Tax=Tetrapyrgos nigripes TaxID=182062 RepID=A0A8H5GZ36_9AGAR|nr:hypothetical protein D9758_000791 [Tetrapyrgos nigripes]